MKKILTLLLATTSLTGIAANVNNLNNVGSLTPLEVNGGGACVTSNIQGALASGFLSYAPGIGTHAILIDPTGTGGAGDPGCGGDFTGMLFDVQDVTFLIADQTAFGAGDGLGTATYEVSLHNFAVSGDSTMGPGAAIAVETQVFTADASGTYAITTPFASQEALAEPFFVAWKLISFVPSVSATGTISPLWDAVARPVGRQFIDNDGGGFVDQTTFFAGGENGWVDVVVTGDFYQPGPIAPPASVPSLSFYGLILLSLGLLWMVRSKVKL